LKFVYTVWFRDPSFPPDDQDYEWPACFVIAATDDKAAREWGDHLAQKYAAASKQVLLWSECEDVKVTSLPGMSKLPCVEYGHEASHEEIGW
jgi:hypothetical protein